MQAHLYHTYKHYNGGVYVVLFRGHEEATGKTVIGYKNVVSGDCWTRPADEFEAEVEHEGKMVPRFFDVTAAARPAYTPEDEDEVHEDADKFSLGEKG